MESVYHIVTVRVNETSWAHVWRLRSRYLGTGYDSYGKSDLTDWGCCCAKDYAMERGPTGAQQCSGQTHLVEGLQE
jgi:hypothetical protein